jgi:hypothetical protein
VKRTLQRNAAASPWAAIDEARFAWEGDRRRLDDQLIEIGVRARILPDGTRVPLVTVDEHGLLFVDLGCGVRISGRDSATLLAAVPGGLLRLAAERRARAQRSKAVLAAKAERLEERKAELATGGAR